MTLVAIGVVLEAVFQYLEKFVVFLGFHRSDRVFKVGCVE
jgi:hypothetical protein